MRNPLRRWIPFAALAGLTACAGPNPGARRALNNYLDAYYGGRAEEAYSYVSAEDKAAKPLNAYLKETRPLRVLSSALGDDVSWDIKKMRVEDDRAQADVALRMPTLGYLMREGWDTFTGDETSFKEFLAEAVAKARKGEWRTTTENRAYRLVREDKEWKVDAGWREETAARAAQDSQARAYLDKMNVLNVAARRESGAAQVAGEVQNAGEKTVTGVTMTVVYLDGAGRPIHEETLRPVAVNPLPGGDTAPLKPGYVRKFAHRSASVPTGWAGKVKVTPTEVTLQ